MLVAKVGAEQNVSTSYARRRRRITVMDGGSIPPISTLAVVARWGARLPRAYARGGRALFCPRSLSEGVARIARAARGRNARRCDQPDPHGAPNA